MKVTVDDDRCRGHGVCWSICPEIFTLTDDGYAVAVRSEVPADHEDGVRDAEVSCPEHAVTVS